MQIRDILRDRTLFSVEIDQPVAGVARRMADLHVGAILVRANDDLRGLMRFELDRKTEGLHHLKAYVHGSA